jgi:PAS domain-containing protein
VTTDESPSADGYHRPGQYEATVSTMTDGIFIADSSGPIGFVNETIETFVGPEK